MEDNTTGGLERKIACIVELVNRLENSEVDVVLSILEGLESGRHRYGALRVDLDRRDFNSETVEELRDALIYLTAAMIRRAGK